MPGAVAEPDAAEQVTLCRAPAPPGEAGGDGDVLREVRWSSRLPDWNNMPILPGPQRARSAPVRRDIGCTADADGAAVGLVEPGQAGQQGGLARSRRAGHGDDLAAPDGERDTAEGQRLVVAGVEEAVADRSADSTGAPVARHGAHAHAASR